MIYYLQWMNIIETERVRKRGGEGWQSKKKKLVWSYYDSLASNPAQGCRIEGGRGEWAVGFFEVLSNCPRKKLKKVSIIGVTKSGRNCWTQQIDKLNPSKKILSTAAKLFFIVIFIYPILIKLLLFPVKFRSNWNLHFFCWEMEGNERVPKTLSSRFNVWVE
jgi:hypothetical protein